MAWSFKKQLKGGGSHPSDEVPAYLQSKPMPADEAVQPVAYVEVAPVMPDTGPVRDLRRVGELLPLSEAERDFEAASAETVFAPQSESAPASVTPPEKKPRWKKKSKVDKPAKGKAHGHHAVDGPRPIKVLVGFLPDSSEKDTYFYMLGLAQKNLDSENIGWAGMSRFENGYAYEIHEGGAGRGYLESILSHFRSLPPFSAEETHRAYIRTATRTVRVERTPSGLYSVMLPESDATPQSTWLITGKKLAPLVEKRTGLLLGGLVIFLSSLMALMGGYATRYQPYTATFVNIERVPVKKLPHSQWSRLTSLPAGDYVMALKFEKNEWLVQTPSNRDGKDTAPAKHGALGGTGQSPGTRHSTPAGSTGVTPRGSSVVGSEPMPQPALPPLGVTPQPSQTTTELTSPDML